MPSRRRECVLSVRVPKKGGGLRVRMQGYKGAKHLSEEDLAVTDVYPGCAAIALGGGAAREERIQASP